MKSISLEPFNPESKCPKCGNDQLTIEYRPASLTEKLPERIQRLCMRCSFSFDQACLPVNGNGKVHAPAQAKKAAKKKPAAQPA